MTADDDKADDQPTAVAGAADDNAVVADSPRTVAAERYSEVPTTTLGRPRHPHSVRNIMSRHIGVGDPALANRPELLGVGSCR